jgi:hypothetical protein
MNPINGDGFPPRECDESGGFSVIFAEKVIHLAELLGISPQWSELRFGNVSRRISSYTTSQRITAVLAGLACGLRGIAPGNTVLRTNTALQELTGGMFPDQGTIHRWLNQTTEEQAVALRGHLHQVAREHGKFWSILYSRKRLVVDLDAQGLAARGERFERAVRGYLGEGLDRGYQRFVAYVGETHEVLDEFLRPGNTMLTGELKELLVGLNEIFPEECRARTVIRADAHGGTLINLQAMQAAGYSYLCRMMSKWSIQRIRKEHCSAPGRQLAFGDGPEKASIECWEVPQWELHGRRKKDGQVRSRAVVFREALPEGKDFWTVLLTNLTDPTPEELWTQYHERSGTIEEYNDQSERAFHLEVIRTSSFSGLNAIHALVGLCWNLSVWAIEDLKLPPTQAPTAEPSRWVPALGRHRDKS